MNCDGEVSLIPIHASTRIILSSILRSWIEQKERDINMFLGTSNAIDPYTAQWIEQNRSIIECAIKDLYQIDSV